MRFWKYTFTLLLLILSGIGIAILQYPDRNLHIIACDVGQGDAILITYGFTQILTDGGPDSKVLDCLGRFLPFWDREIELVISTHPDADHSTGLVDVFKNYKVDKLLINPIDPGTSVYQALRNAVGGGGTEVINPIVGMKLGSGLIYLDILSPTDGMFTKLTIKKEDDSFSRYSISDNTNFYSVVYRLKFNNFTALMPGDIPPEVSDSLAQNWAAGSVDYIKIPHHGSINGITENLVKATMPKIAVISVGKNNWGFPKPEILSLLAKYNVRVLRTDRMGEPPASAMPKRMRAGIEVVTDGERYRIK